MKNINDLRALLFETMEGVKNGTIDLDQAKTISDIGQTIVNTAKVENDFISKQGGCGSGFIPTIADTTIKLERPKAEYSNSGHINTVKKYA